ncbi:hypothetical protein QN362_18765 [Actimicrobium sp. CCC2.4]|uniref:hypothetical protein n=1 Tax=Actimicrobium sp. CCC2.4 TaxID=3048606 RepID=UPI002AC951E8|nr:hypothetical protein [Actimicrobium sp. CCC2.4]MEB0137376.1 hypothetical protein [Actimicrobium sp. CCC2.4]WPX32556.1 hypothetical protein RHM62_01535 [Actimicrobium sp. CCC2.4]
MMKSTQVLFGSAILVVASFAGAQSLSVGAGLNSNAGTSAPVAVTPMSPANIVVGAGANGAVSVAPPADPYVQKREEDAAARNDAKMKKDMAKEQYKDSKALAESDLKAEKRASARERKARLAADIKAGAKADIGN